MMIISDISASGDAYARLVEGLKIEFGCADIGAIAERIFDAEDSDFHWDARIHEHYLGQHFSLEYCADDETEDLSRVAILNRIQGRWNAGVCIVDGDGNAVDFDWIRSFDRLEDAADAFARAR